MFSTTNGNALHRRQRKSGVAGNGKRWNTGCAFVDYDRDATSISSSPITSISI